MTARFPTSCLSFSRPVITTLLAWATLHSFTIVLAQEASLDFNRDVRPILADKCFHCHGPDPDSRAAELRLDQESSAKHGAIVAGQPDDSEFVRRILSTDADIVMPPPDSGKELTPEEAARLKRWVQEGAVWAGHWSFERLTKPAVPVVSDPTWPRNPIDSFVMAELDRQSLHTSVKLKPSPRTDLVKLARRVCFDLTGLPPTTEQIQAVLNATNPNAYERLVDELLASNRFGERLAMEWLDAARYADSDGYQADATRQNWPWRDWVIDAFNNNMPFDRFTVEQFAGDLLPNASPQQILATCFHRNHMHNGEGGRDPEESRIEYVIDRVNTVGTVWLGLTLECAQCHTHKYDPISHAEYYQLNAFFNSIDEDGKAGGGAGPFLKFESPYVTAGQQDSIDWLKQMESDYKRVREQSLQQFEPWLQQQREHIQDSANAYQSWQTAQAEQLTTTGGTQLTQSNGIITVSGADPRHDDYLITLKSSTQRMTGLRLTVLPSEAVQGRLSGSADGHFILTNLKVRIRSADGTRERDIPVAQAVASEQAGSSGRGYGPVSTVLDDDPRTGWTTSGSSAQEAKVAAFAFAEPLILTDDEALVIELRQRSLQGHSNLQKFVLEVTSEAGPAATALEETPLEQLAQLLADASVPANLLKQLQAQYLADQPELLQVRRRVDQARRRKNRYDAAAKAQSVTVLKEREQARDTHVLVRGVWNNKGETVSPGTPQALTLSAQQPQNRLQLARWLVDDSQPLTPRVIVNRYWQMHFGYGLVRTPGDFGTQGESPTHPDLLDWLAAEFVESGWNIKHVHRLIVTSATYQQSSDVNAEMLELDPENRLLARATRFRLPSWMIRDAALSVSGLLSERIGGPPVFPYQPEGAWLDATMGRFRYETSVGADRYRRSLYTFWRRSVGPTGMFDASRRRVCEVRSIRTNTPLHALNLMNDLTFVEAAEELAAHIIERSESTPPSEMKQLFQQILNRLPTAEEQEILQHQFEQHVQEYGGDAEPAWVLLATTILNLDETITHE